MKENTGNSRCISDSTQNTTCLAWINMSIKVLPLAFTLAYSNSICFPGKSHRRTHKSEGLRRIDYPEFFAVCRIKCYSHVIQSIESNTAKAQYECTSY